MTHANPSPGRPTERSVWLDAALIAVLVGLGAGLRLAFRDLPNFAPVAALALFAGYRLSNRWLAAAVPLLVMGLSDLVIGGYDLRMMAVVYGMLTAPVAFGGLTRRYLPLDGASPGQTGAAAGGLLACSLASSCAFFLVTNFASWAWFGGYPLTPAGLVDCYVQALPFFRYTLLGDVCFGVVFFGGYAALRLRAAQADAALESRPLGSRSLAE